MHSMVRAVGRLVLMALVMAAVLVTATAVGLPATVVLGLAITAAGVVGLISLARRGSRDVASEYADSLYAVPALDATARSAIQIGAAPGSDPDARRDAVLDSMAPGAEVDPESLMPRWRRPSLLAARRADPTRVTRVERTPLRFGATAEPSPNRRIVRYAVVSLLDRPDEILGRQVSDLMAGDEVEVLDNGGPFWEILCPDGMRGWVHRTTLGMPGADGPSFGRRVAVSEPDDILTAVLSARGIQ
jgi:hypothetical protein